jgi:serine/threonine-protein kinase
MIDLIGRRLGEYELTSVLGQGGMAVVYRAQQQNIKREVAVKVIQPTLRQNSDFSVRFTREAQTIAGLSHPHILKVFDYGVLRGFHLRLLDPQADATKDMIYVVMELLTGGTLNHLIRSRSTPLDLTSIQGFTTDIASALDYAHQKGVIHCDLKPENVLLDETGNAFLADFGIAQLLSEMSEHDTPSDIIAGTPRFMAPEQWNGLKPSAQTDIYALGIMLFQMLTGHAPYNEDTPLKLMQQHLNAPIPDVRAQRPDLPESVQAIFTRALAKNPGDRYASAGQLADAFTRATKRRDSAPTSVINVDGVRAAVASASSKSGAAMPTIAPFDAKVSTPTTNRIPSMGWWAAGALGLIAVILAIALIALNANNRSTPTDQPTTHPLLGNHAVGAFDGLNLPQAVDTLAAATLTARAVDSANAAGLATLANGDNADISATIAARVQQMGTPGSP